MTNAQLQLLTAVRESSLALTLAIDAFLDEPQDAAPVSDCAAGHHPAEGRIDASAMGRRAYHCGACHELVEMGEA